MGLAQDGPLGPGLGPGRLVGVVGAKAGVLPLAGLGSGPYIGHPPGGVAPDVPEASEGRPAVVEVVVGLVLPVGRRRPRQVQSQVEGKAVATGVALVQVLGPAVPEVLPATSEEAVESALAVVLTAIAKDEGQNPTTGQVAWYATRRFGVATSMDAEGARLVLAVGRHDVRFAVDQVGLAYLALRRPFLAPSAVRHAVRQTENARIVPASLVVATVAGLPTTSPVLGAPTASPAVPQAPVAVPSLALPETSSPVLASPTTVLLRPSPTTVPPVLPEVRVRAGARNGLAKAAIRATKASVATRRAILATEARDDAAQGSMGQGATALLAIPGLPATGGVVGRKEVAASVGTGPEVALLEVGEEAPLGPIGLIATASPSVAIGPEAAAVVVPSGVVVVVAPLGLEGVVPTTEVRVAGLATEGARVVLPVAVLPTPGQDS